MNTDEALVYVGSWGRYQKMVYALIFISGIPNAFFVMHFVFSNYEPPHRCRLPNYSENSTKYDLGNSSVLNFMIPDVTDKEGKVQKSQCHMYNRTSTNWRELTNSSNETLECTEGYVFDLEQNQMSAVTEFSMVCKDDWKSAVAVAMYSAGNAAGAFLSSLGDRFGRRPIFLVSCVLHILSGAFMSVTWNSYVYIASGFFCAMFGQINWIAPFVVGTEITDPSWRNFMAVSSMYSFTVGYCLVAGLGYFFLNWRWFLGVSSILGAVAYLPNYWLFPESPRWLAQKGRSEEAMKWIKKIAKTNGKTKNFEEMIEVKGTEIEAKNEDHPTGVVDTLKILFRSGIGDRCIVLMFSWFVASLTYYAISYFSKNFSDDRFLNVLFGGLTEFPAYLCGFYFVKIIGRPRSMFTFMMICGLTSIILPFVPKDLTLVKTILSILGKAAVSAVFYVNYLVASEIVPTLQRSSNLSICSAFARIGSFTAPFLMYMGKIHPTIPNLVMGGLAITSGMFSIFYIPETNGLAMPDSAEEARNNKRIFGIRLFKTFDNKHYKGEENGEDKEEML